MLTDAEQKAARYLKSSYIERLVEHVFISEVLQEEWNTNQRTVEVLRPEVDASGYDVVFECNGKLRYVQLKTSEEGAKAASQKVNVALAKKPGGCVIWIIRDMDAASNRLKLRYLYYGKGPGISLDLDRLAVAKHTKGNAQGVKGERPAIRVIPKSHFEVVRDARKLVKRLFG